MKITKTTHELSGYETQEWDIDFGMAPYWIGLFTLGALFLLAGAIGTLG